MLSLDGLETKEKDTKRGAGVSAVLYPYMVNFTDSFLLIYMKSYLK